MDPITAMMLAQAGVGAYQLIKGQMQLANNQRPTYEIPQEVKDNLNQAQLQALEGLPEAQRKMFVENIQRSKANAVASLQDRRSGLVGLTGLAQTETDAYRNLLSQDVAARQANQAKLMEQNQVMANYKDKAFEANQMEPYRFKANQANALIGSGMQNLMSAGYAAANLKSGQPAQNAVGGQSAQIKQAPSAVEYESRYATPITASQPQQQIPLVQNFYQSNQQMPQNPNNTYQPLNLQYPNDPYASLGLYGSPNN